MQILKILQNFDFHRIDKPKSVPDLTWKILKIYSVLAYPSEAI